MSELSDDVKKKLGENAEKAFEKVFVEKVEQARDDVWLEPEIDCSLDLLIIQTFNRILTNKFNGPPSQHIGKEAAERLIAETNDQMRMTQGSHYQPIIDELRENLNRAVNIAAEKAKQLATAQARIAELENRENQAMQEEDR